MRPDLRRIQLMHWGLVALLATAGWLAGRPGPGGVVLGGTVTGLSLALSAAGMSALLRTGQPRLAFGILFVKLLALFGLTWVAFVAARPAPDPIGFALGVGCLPVAGVVEALRVRERS